MDASKYQELTGNTAIYPTDDVTVYNFYQSIMNAAVNLGLAANASKKVIRDDNQTIENDKGTTIKIFLQTAHRKVENAYDEVDSALARELNSFEIVKDAGLVYSTLALVGEVGETVEKVLAYLNFINSQHKLPPEVLALQRSNIRKEMGGMLYYAARICEHAGIDMGELMQENIDILADRKRRGVIKGSGDNR